MNDETKGQNLELIKSVLSSRTYTIWAEFKDVLPTMFEVDKVRKLELTDSKYYTLQEGVYEVYQGDLIVGATWYGIKDTFVPIREYIAQLRATEHFSQKDS